MIISLTPIAYAVIWGLCGTKNPGTFSGFTLFWIGNLLTEKEWIGSLTFSVALGFGASTFSMLAVAVADYLARLSHFGYKPISSAFLLLVLLCPQIIYGIALRYCLGIVPIPPIAALIVANIVLILPVQNLVVEAGRNNISNLQLQAATTLGASTIEGLWRVYFPLMWKAIISGWMVGFLMAFDELVIAISVWDNPTEPVAKRLWQLYGRSSEPYPGAITLIVLFLPALVGCCFIASRIYKARGKMV